MGSLQMMQDGVWRYVKDDGTVMGQGAKPAKSNTNAMNELQGIEEKPKISQQRQVEAKKGNTNSTARTSNAITINRASASDRDSAVRQSYATRDHDYDEIIAGLNSSEIRYETGLKDLEKLWGNYNAAPSVENANAYNNRLAEVQADVKAYNSYVEQYANYYSEAGLKEREDAAQQAKESADRLKQLIDDADEKMAIAQNEWDAYYVGGMQSEAKIAKDNYDAASAAREIYIEEYNHAMQVYERAAKRKEIYKADKESYEDYMRWSTMDVDQEKNTLAYLEKMWFQLVDERTKQQTLGSGYESAFLRGDELDAQISALEKEISALKTDISQAESAQKANEYAAMMEMPDFDKWAAKGAAIENPTFEENERVFGGKEKREKNVGNIVAYSFDNAGQIAAADANGVAHAGDFLYTFLEKDEVELYNAILAKDGKDASQDFLDYMMPTLQARYGKAIGESVNAIKNPIGRTAMQGLMGFGAGVDRWIGGTRQFFTDEVQPTTSTQVASQIIQESLGKGGQLLYGAATAVGNMLPSILLANVAGGIAGGIAGATGATAATVGKVAGQASKITSALTMGTSATGNTYNQAMQLAAKEGFTKEQAKTYAAFVGAFEAGLSYLLGGAGNIMGLGEEKLLAKVAGIENVATRLILRGAISIGSEEFEELAQLWVEPTLKKLILDTEFEAPTWEEHVETAIITALSTFVMNNASGSGAIHAEINYDKYGKYLLQSRTKDAVINEALSALAPNTKAYKLAQTLRAQIENGKSPSTSDIGRLRALTLYEQQGQLPDLSYLLDGIEPMAKENTSPAEMAMDEVESTAINTDPSQHTPQEQAVINEYQQSVDQDVVSFVQRWKTLKNPDYKKKIKMTVAKVTSRAIADVKKLIGLDISEYKHIINGNSLYHIEKRHGENGKHDHSMADVNDIARIGYVLENYDTVDISYDKNNKAITSGYISNADGTPAIHIVFKKKVNGTYYVIEAAPDSAAKNLVVTSAYMQKGSTDQVLNMPQATSSHTPEAPHGANTPYNNVSQPAQPVNGNNSQNNQENDLSFLLDNESERFAPEGGNTQQTEAETAVGATRYDSNSWSTFQNEAESGYHPEGANAARPTDVPIKGRDGRNISRVANNAMGAQMVPDRAVTDLEQSAMRGDFSYDTVTDQGSLDNAQAHIDDVGFDVAFGETMNALENGTTESKQTIVNGFELVRRAYQMNSTEGDAKAMELLVALQSKITDSAQALQAASMMRKLTPEGQLLGLQRTVDRINQNIKNKKNKKNKKNRIGLPKNVEIDPKLRRQFLAEKDADKRQEILDQIYLNIGEQMPTTFREVIEQIRYTNMLIGPSTHIKNITTNTTQTGMKLMKDAFATGIEAVVNKITGGRTGRTKAIINFASKTDQALLKQAWGDFGNVSDLISGVGKYSQENTKIREGRTIMKVNDPKNKFTKAVDKVLRAGEKVSKANSKALDVEDTWFSQPNYAISLAQYMKANNLTQITDAARAYAIKEAQKATLRDANALSTWAQSLTRKNPNDNGVARVAKGLVKTVMPFAKTNANATVRTLEYSPIGLVKSLTYDLAKVKQGEMTATEAIDDIAAGLTGVALWGLGVLLVKFGLLRFRGIGDEKEKRQQRSEGYKDFSFANLPVAWTGNVAIQLMAGAAIYEHWATQNLDKDEGVSLDSVLQGIEGVLDPLLEQSMFDGFQDVLTAGRDQDNGAAGTLVDAFLVTPAKNLISSLLVPTPVRRLGNALDTYGRETYIDKNKSVAGQEFFQDLLDGIPVLSNTKKQRVDIYGGPVYGGVIGGEEWWKKALDVPLTVVTPVFPGKVKTTALDNEIKRIYRDPDVNTDGLTLFVQEAPKSFEIGGEKVHLTADQHTQYEKALYGGTIDTRNAIFTSELYEQLPPQAKGLVMHLAHDFSNQMAKTDLGIGYNAEKWAKELFEANDDDIANAIIQKALESDGVTNYGDQTKVTSYRNAIYDINNWGAVEDSVMDAAMEKAVAFNDAMARQKMGFDVDTEWIVDAKDLSEEEQVEVFFCEALDDLARKAKNDGEGKYDGLGRLIDDGVISDTLAYFGMSATMQEAYDSEGGGSKFTAEDLIDVYAYAKRNGGNDKKAERNAVIQFIQSEHKGDATKAAALTKALYAVMPDVFTKDVEIPTDYLKTLGSEGRKIAYQQLSKSQKEKYLGMDLAGTGLDIFDYTAFVDFAGKQNSDKDSNGKVTKSAREKVIDWLNANYWNTTQKKELYYSLYATKSPWG